MSMTLHVALDEKDQFKFALLLQISLALLRCILKLEIEDHFISTKNFAIQT